MSRTLARTLIGVAMLGALALVGTACASSAGDAAPTSTPTDGASANAADIVGHWGDDATGKPHLEFTEDGAVNGSDGCNGISTTYVAADGRFELAPFASTLKACVGVDDWLRSVRAVEIDGDVLVALDSSGARLGELARAH